MQKNRYFLLVIVVILSSAVPFMIIGYTKSETGGRAGQAKIMYHCPMHPTYISDKPGDCPICGMKLVRMESKTENKPKESGTANTVKTSEDKNIEEVCIDHKCTMNGCIMDVRIRMKPGEKIICPICGEVITTANGKIVEIIKQPQQKTATAKKERKLLYYRNPMNPQATSPVPMKDSMGMDYGPVYEEAATEGAGPTIMVSSEKQQLIGVRTEAVKRITLTKAVRASGKIAYDPELVITQEEFIQANNNNDNINELKDIIKNIKVIRSSELVYVAYKLNLLDKYIDGATRKRLLDSVLWGVKLDGCAISKAEIEQIKDLEA